MGGLKVLLLFTGVYPFGRKESFVENEINYLSSSFDRVIIFPQSVDDVRRSVPSNVEVMPLPVLKGGRKAQAVFLKAIFSLIFWRGIFEVFRGKKPFYRLRTLLSYVGLAKTYTNFVEQHVLPDLPKEARVFLYSYWMDRGALTVAMLGKRHHFCSVVSRAHAFDVYEERNPDSYLPLRKEILSGLNAVHAISLDALNYLRLRHGDSSLFKVSRLGTAPGNVSMRDKGCDDSFHLISVSNVVPVKRVELIASSVVRLAEKHPHVIFRWTHFGDGPLFEDLKTQVSNFRMANLKVDLRGGQLNSVVRAFYESERPDLFINLSASEGIPVSFMEAMSFGVPVLATDVGGVSEILSPTCGFLLHAGVSPEQVAEEISSILARPNLLSEISAHAFDVWRQFYSADVTYSAFCRDILVDSE